MKQINPLNLIAGFLVALSTFAFADKKPRLEGYCLVCYHDAGKAVKGSPEFATTHGDNLFYFPSAEAKAKFDKNPAKYYPEYNGYCAHAMADGRKVEIDPTAFSLVNNKLYFNYDHKVKAKFDADQQGFIEKADKEWAKMQKKMAVDKKG